MRMYIIYCKSDNAMFFTRVLRSQYVNMRDFKVPVL